jgi:hypothetical protein
MVRCRETGRVPEGASTVASVPREVMEINGNKSEVIVSLTTLLTQNDAAHSS